MLAAWFLAGTSEIHFVQYSKFLLETFSFTNALVLDLITILLDFPGNQSGENKLIQNIEFNYSFPNLTDSKLKSPTKVTGYTNNALNVIKYLLCHSLRTINKNKNNPLQSN